MEATSCARPFVHARASLIMSMGAGGTAGPSGNALPGRLKDLAPRRFVILLKVLIVFLLLSSLFDETGARGFGLLLLSTLVALTTIYAASAERRHLILGLCLGAMWGLLAWSAMFWPLGAAQVAADLFFIALSFLAISVAFRWVLLSEIRRIDINVVCGGIVIYLLLGITWALSYRVIEELAPGSFSLTASDRPPPWSELLYYSYTTLTTLGYGDIVPLRPFARIWATMEAVAGALYLAILIARIVSLYRQEAADT